MRILVTGAGGFVGARLAADLAKAGHDVTAVWHRVRARLLADPPENLVYRQADLVAAEIVDALFQEGGRFDAIVHAAALVPAKDQDVNYLRAAILANVVAQANLVAASKRAGDLRFVFTSTISVYGNRGAPPGGYRETDAAPTNYYGWSKYAAERLLDVAAGRGGMRAMTLRLAGVHGVGREAGALAAMARAALAEKPISVAEPESRFRWAFIEDVSQAVAKAVTTDLPAGHRVANVASADIFTLAELAEHVKMVAGSTSRIETDAQERSRRNEVMNIDAAERLLEFVPTPLGKALVGYLENLLPV